MTLAPIGWSRSLSWCPNQYADTLGWSHALSHCWLMQKRSYARRSHRYLCALCGVKTWWKVLLTAALNAGATHLYAPGRKTHMLVRGDKLSLCLKTQPATGITCCMRLQDTHAGTVHYGRANIRCTMKICRRRLLLDGKRCSTNWLRTSEGTTI